MQTTKLPKHDIVLLGVGHTNAHVLRMWRMYPPRDARLTCISNFPIVTYSGMLPGVLAGQYPREQMQIDLVRLCAAAGARLVLGNVVGIDREQRRILFEDRASITYELLSIGIGSVPTANGVAIDSDLVLPLKPMQTFLDRFQQRLDAARERSDEAIQVAVIGAGAGGFEVALCLERRLRNYLGSHPFAMTVVHGGEDLIGGVSAKTVDHARRELEQRGIRLLLNQRVTSVRERSVQLDSGSAFEADVVLWATGAVAAPLLGKLDVEKDDRGFLLTEPTLQTVNDKAIFAVGDSGTLRDNPTPKAGVYAVRQGPVLWDNIWRTLRGEPLSEYVPQRDFLKLFNLGDGRALGEYKGWTFAGKWAWRLKDRIDRKFMAMYQDYQPMEMDEPEEPEGQAEMRCTGCGGKVGGSILSRVLQRLDVPAHDHVLLGLEAPDDAAILRFPAGKAINATVDFFAAPLDDPYTSGRLAALNSASDCFATGARPVAALAAITIPVGGQRQQEQLLYEILEGSLREFRDMGATLVGGHTIEGPQLTIGFTMLAEQQDPPRTKKNLRVGDQLVLTKPLGAGILLAALMRARCRAEWYESLLRSMLISNRLAAELCDEFDIQALTDVTGFGLAGHLLEMLRPSQLAAVLQLSQIPLLPGTAELLQTGIESTLAPANRQAETDMEIAETLRNHPAYASLFDPQTCGGLLMAVPESRAAALLANVERVNGFSSALIGTVVAASPAHAMLRITQ